MPFLIRTKKYQYAFWSILLLLTYCKEKSNTKVIIKPPISFPKMLKHSTEVDTKFITEAIKAGGGKSIGFYYGITNLFGKEYFLYLDKKDSLTFIQIADKSIRKLCIDSIIKNLDEYKIGQIQNNQILFLNNNEKTLFHYLINEDFSIRYIKKVQLNGTGAIKKTNFNVSPDASRFLLMDSLLFINYSKGNGGNFIDNTALMYFNINKSQPNPEFMIEYPKNYQTERIYLCDLLFTAINDSSLAFAYFQSDNIGLLNTKNNTILRTNINRKDGYLTFVKEKEKNLGYVSKYLQTNETNYKLFSDSTQRIYLFKRLAKAQKNDTTAMECYLYDTQLNPIYFFKLNQEVCPSYIYKYQKGFLAFTKDFTKAYYYEF